MIHSPKDRALSRRVQYYQDPKKVRQFKSRVKVMLIAFFDMRGVMHMEFLP